MSSDRMKCETEEMLHWQTAAQYYQAAGYKREYPYGYEYPGRQENIYLAAGKYFIWTIWKIFNTLCCVLCLEFMVNLCLMCQLLTWIYV